MTVTAEQIKKAKDFGLQNVDVAAQVANETGIKFNHLCALLQHESMGKNIYGHDSGGALSGFSKPVTKDNYDVFRWLILNKGQTSNGVGPMQLTFKGFFTDMEKKGLKPWDVHDNMTYGAKLWNDYYRSYRDQGLSPDESVRKAGVRYNGASSYGDTQVRLVKEWRDRVGNADYA